MLTMLGCALIVSSYCSPAAMQHIRNETESQVPSSKSTSLVARDQVWQESLRPISVLNCVLLHHERDNRNLRRKEVTNLPRITNKTDVCNDSLPQLILHMGPEKTGTTTIQRKLSTLSPQLQKDKYFYIGNNAGPTHMPGVYNYCNAEKECAISNKLESYLEAMRHKGLNLVGSNEFLGRQLEGGQAWRKTTAGKWNFGVTFTYRRLFEIIPSHYNQWFKKKRFPDGSIKGRNGHEDWPGTNGDYEIPAFADYVIKAHWLEVEKAHSVKSAYSYWQCYANSVQLFNFHQHGGLAANFVCQTIPKANHTCAKLKRKEKRSLELHENPSKPLDYDILAVHVYKQGLLKKRLKRKEVTKAAQYYNEQVKGLSVKDLPQRCLNSTALDTIYKLSLDLETWAMSTSSSEPVALTGMVLKSNQHVLKPLTPAQILDFNNSWNKVLEDKKFCTVDCFKVMEQKDWQDFFENYPGSP